MKPKIPALMGDGRVLVAGALGALLGATALASEAARTGRMTGGSAVRPGPRLAPPPAPSLEHHFPDDRVTKADFRPRTRPGFYRRASDGEVLRVDAVSWFRPHPGRSLTPNDWELYAIGTMTDVGRRGPSDGTLASSVFMKVHQLHPAGYRRVKEEDLSPAWRAFFARHPVDTGSGNAGSLVRPGLRLRAPAVAPQADLRDGPRFVLTDPDQPGRVVDHLNRNRLTLGADGVLSNGPIESRLPASGLVLTHAGRGGLGGLQILLENGAGTVSQGIWGLHAFPWILVAPGFIKVPHWRTGREHIVLDRVTVPGRWAGAADVADRIVFRSMPLPSDSPQHTTGTPNRGSLVRPGPRLRAAPPPKRNKGVLGRVMFAPDQTRMLGQIVGDPRVNHPWIKTLGARPDLRPEDVRWHSLLAIRQSDTQEKLAASVDVFVEAVPGILREVYVLDLFDPRSDLDVTTIGGPVLAVRETYKTFVARRLKELKLQKKTTAAEAMRQVVEEWKLAQAKPSQDVRQRRGRWEQRIGVRMGLWSLSNHDVSRIWPPLILDRREPEVAAEWARFEEVVRRLEVLGFRT